MIISKGLKCESCGHRYRIRVGVGFDSYQKYYFDCSNCNINIVFAVRTKPPRADVEVVENCSLFSGEPNIELEVLNFHPNCAFNKHDLHNPLCFPTLISGPLIIPHMRYIPSRMQSIDNQFDIPNAPHKWSLIKGMITNIQDNKKASNFVSQYTKHRNKDMNPSSSDFVRDKEIIVYKSGSVYSEFHIIHEFFDSLFYPMLGNIVEPIINTIKTIPSSELSSFIRYWQSELKQQNQYRYLNTFSEYFRHRDHFGQIVMYSRIGHNVDDLIVSSNGFEQIKLYYGDTYEALTSNITIIAFLNNIMDGREFDEFKSMKLSKYLEINKANKSNPFKSTPIFSVFAENDIESSIRNGSHHASIWRDGEKIMYRSGGTGAEHSIPYTRYLDYCNRLTIKLAALFIIECYLSEYVNDSKSFVVN